MLDELNLSIFQSEECFDFLNAPGPDEHNDDRSPIIRCETHMCGHRRDRLLLTDGEGADADHRRYR